MASKPSSWFSNKGLRLSLRRLRRSTSRSGGGGRDFREVFRRVDADGDGRVSSGELRAFLLWAGEGEVSAEGAEGVMREWDGDGDGMMEYEEFVRLVDGSGGGDEAALRRAFEEFEAEKGSGRITAAGLQRVLARLGEAPTAEECAAMIRAYDLDGDGELDYNEFRRMMTS